MTGCRSPTAWVTARKWPCADPCHSSHRLISANCAGGRERQRPASGSLPLGLMSGPLLSRRLAMCPGQSQGVGQGRETAAASDPEQKTGVRTPGSTRGRVWAPGASGLALVARTCRGREAGWRALLPFLEQGWQGLRGSTASWVPDTGGPWCSWEAGSLHSSSSSHSAGGAPEENNSTRRQQ